MAENRFTAWADSIWALSRKRSVKIALIGVLILLPFIVSAFYSAMTALPGTIRIATGPDGGLYRRVSEDLAQRIERDLGVRVERIHTRGSLENLLLLETGRADLALYQPGTHQMLGMHDPGIVDSIRRDYGLPEIPKPGHVQFVANLYSQPAHLYVRRGSGIRRPEDLRGRRVAIGLKGSGDMAMSLAFLEHYGLTDDIRAEHLPYEAIRDEFLTKDPKPGKQLLDAALISIGVQAPIYEELARTNACDLVEIPADQGLAKKYVFLTRFEVPTGFYAFHPRPLPDRTIHTVAAGAQLLTHEGVSTSLVERVTSIVTGENFITDNRLDELFEGGEPFARRRSGYPLHIGAQNRYYPELRPLLNPDFVDSLAGMQSFVFSVVISLFLGARWLYRRQIRRREHKLDWYLRELLNIEVTQMSLDSQEGRDDTKQLNELLDQVTQLRQRVLREITAHQLTDDDAVHCFINMCHALSNKINAKISRQRLDKGLAAMAAGKTTNGRTNGKQGKTKAPRPKKARRGKH